MNSLGQRTSVSTEGEAFGATPADWAWRYDVLGQVISANEDSYAYDQIGNRRISRTGDDADTVYTANALNQYSRIGTTTPTHDADGNQLTGLTPTEGLSGRDTLSFTYNAENRPINVAQNGEVRESYSYDHMGRRIHKGDTVTLYDGYNAIAEYKSNTRTLKTTYAWGHDLSGTAQGAGGVGGMLAVTEHDRQLPLISYPCYDGNGNITEYLTEEGAGTIAAHYEYDALGQVNRKTGNRDYSYQFSTKPCDVLTGLNYYNYRNYDSVLGRWITRDPISEEGGFNLYGMVNNSSLSYIDHLGQDTLGEEIYLRYVVNYLMKRGVWPLDQTPMIAQMEESLKMQKTFEKGLKNIIKNRIKEIKSYPQTVEIDFGDGEDITKEISVHLNSHSGLNLHTSGWWLGRPQKILGYGKFSVCVKSEGEMELSSSEGVSLVWHDTIDANPTEGDPAWQQFIEWIVQKFADPLAAFPIEVWGNFTYGELDNIINDLE